MNFRGAWAILLACSICFPLVAQSERGLVRVPFVGCKSVGQAGPHDAPEGRPVLAETSAEAASRLAYYRAAQGIGGLGPRGWSCLGDYGSGGAILLISPEPPERIEESTRDLGAPVIEINFRSSGTSGRYDVARVIARVFPAHMAFVRRVQRWFPVQQYPVGPYPHDKLTYRSDSVVEYETPAQADGLGTYSWLKKNDSPIRGVAILLGPTPDLLFVAARLPQNIRYLTRAVIRQAERETAIQY